MDVGWRERWGHLGTYMLEDAEGEKFLRVDWVTMNAGDNESCMELLMEDTAVSVRGEDGSHQ